MIHTRRCTGRAALLTAVVAAMLGTGSGFAQDDLAAAKTLYVNASYEEALGVLDKQAAAAGAIGARAAELHHYRALCLIALGRTTEADQAIALSVTADPFSVPDTSELSPRVASVFSQARARLVPDVARAALAEGRTLMQKGDAAAANKRFEAVTKLLSEPGLAGRTDLTDLTLAATAFTELTRAQMAATAAAAAATTAAAAPPPPAATVTPPPAATPPVTSAPATGGATASRPTPPAARAGAQPVPAGAQLATPPPAAAGAARPSAPASTNDSNFVAAVPISQVLPPWQPGPSAFGQLGFQGAVRVTIDAAGKVTGAVMERPTYPPYDRLVLAAARNWTYRPATRDGQPVTSERLVEIVLRPRSN